MTPAQLNLVIKAHTKRREDELRISQALNYQLATLIRAAVWAKRMPSYESVLGKDESEHKQEAKKMDEDEMYAQVCALNRLFGGSVEE